MFVNWRALAEQAIRMSMEVRKNAGLDFDTPIDVYALCDRLNVPVRFVDFSMEGMYVKVPSPYILISALRPFARRAFTCGHELGHHVFGHGSTIDELIQIHQGKNPLRSGEPDEFLVNAFSGALLMPTLGLREAYLRRRIKPSEATPEQHFAVACSFGVGYTTLLNHLCYGTNMLTITRAKQLSLITPQKVRDSVLGIKGIGSTIMADKHWQLPTLDAEVGMNLLLPSNVMVSKEMITPKADTTNGRLFQIDQPGIARLEVKGMWSIFLRIARKQYVGLDKYRHLEVEPGDEEEFN